MTRAQGGCLAFLLALACVACASHRSTTQTRSGSATVTTSQDSKSVTVQTNEGTTSIGQPVDVGTLGVPLYPGAQAGQPASITTVKNAISTTIANFMTTDAFDTVYAYYKRQLPPASEKMKVTSANGSVASFQVGGPTDADTVSVQISSDRPNLTNILITHATKTQR
ncbi:MAG: hypothetical protein JOY69_08370 [Candidatus Eremiobacteraeota bacterium]|nr:hypothetical protein [Candidatus Eremiobacteraeota bacterium]